jgi:hypothetical protein
MKNGIKIAVFAGVSLAVNYAVMSLTVATGMTPSAWAGVVLVSIGVTTAYAVGLPTTRHHLRGVTTKF